MDTKLHDRVFAKLDNLASLGDWVQDFNDPTTVIEYVEGNATGLANIWNNIASNLDRLCADKSDRVFKSAYKKAVRKLKRLKTYFDPDDELSTSVMKKVLNLIDEAITNCPFNASELARVFSLRSVALFEFDQVDLALIAVNQALFLSPESVTYRIYKAQYLCKLERHYEAYRLVKRYIRKPTEVIDEEEIVEESLLVVFENVLLDIQEHIKHKPLADVLQDHDLIDLSETEEDRDIESSYDSNKDVTGDEFEYNLFDLVDKEKHKNYSIDYRCTFQASPHKGRYICTEEDLPKGTFVFRERSYSMIILPEMRLNNCHSCGRDVSNRFWPCVTCNQMVYCDQECAKLDWQLSHRFDCGMTEYWLGTSKSTFHVFRLMNRLGVEGILTVLDEQQKQLQEQWQYDLTAYREDQIQRYIKEENKDTFLQRKAYLAQLTLMDHSSQYSQDTLAHNMTNAIECAIMACLLQGLDFSQMSRAQLVRLIGHCFVQIRRVLTNSFRWSGYNNYNEPVDIATCVTLLGSLFNHSCDPNCEWSFHEGSLRVTTVRSLKANEEITISYGPYSSSVTIDERQKHLSQCYFFQCSCSACLEDSRSVFALQCAACPGPVLLNNSAKYKDSHCLMCFETYPKTRDKMALLKQNYQVLFDYVRSCLKDKETYLVMLKESLEQIRSVIYRPSVILLESIYAVCQVFQQGGFLAECVHYGAVVDSIIPFDETVHLISLPNLVKMHQQESPGNLVQYTTKVISLNIEHMMFWTSIYRTWIESTRPIDQQIWTQMLHFYKRLRILIQLGIAFRKLQLAKQQEQIEEEEEVEQETLDSTARLEKEIDVLNKLNFGKQKEMERIKRKYGQGVNFGQIEV